MNHSFGDYSFLWRKIKFKYRISFWTKEWPSSVKSFYVCIDFKNDQWSHRANKNVHYTNNRPRRPGDSSVTKSIQILINGTHSIRIFKKSWFHTINHSVLTERFTIWRIWYASCDSRAPLNASLWNVEFEQRLW